MRNEYLSNGSESIGIKEVRMNASFVLIFDNEAVVCVSCQMEGELI